MTAKLVLPQLDTVGEPHVRRYELLTVSVKVGSHSPPGGKNALFQRYFLPLFKFTNSINFRESGSLKYTLTQKIKLSPTIHTAFDQFEAIDVPFNWPSTVGQTQTGLHCRFVTLDARSEVL